MSGKLTLRTAAVAVLAVTVVASLAFGLPRLLRRTHQTEAIRELARIARSASVYYVKPRAAAQGGRMLCQFPPGEIRTTPARSCCDPAVNDGAGRCDPGKIEWNRTLWHALRWQIAEKHAYVYSYEAAGTLGDARMTVSAYGDLDCDGEYATFRFVGRGDAKSTVDDCILTEAAEFEAIQPDE